MRRMASGVVRDGRDGCFFGGCLWKWLVFCVSVDSPARLGPKSRGVVPETASNWLPDRPLEATTMSVWLEMLPRWFLERFGSQRDPNLGSSWAPLGTAWGPKMQYLLRFFDVFTCSLSST